MKTRFSPTEMLTGIEPPAWHYMLPLVGDPLLVIRVAMTGKPGKRTRHVIRWRDLLNALFAVMKQDHGLRRKDLLAIDPIFHPDDEVDPPWAKPSKNRIESATITRRNIEAAYQGDLAHYPAFWLYEWSDTEKRFILIRKPRVEYLGRPTTSLRGDTIQITFPDETRAFVPFKTDGRPNRNFGDDVERAVIEWYESHRQDPEIGRKRLAWIHSLDTVASIFRKCDCSDEQLLSGQHEPGCPSRSRPSTLL